MKKAISIFLLIVLSAPAFLKLGTLTNYLIEYERYVRILCENRDKPELKCNGTCHLSKELKAKKQSTENDPPAIPANLKIELNLFFEWSVKSDFTFSQNSTDFPTWKSLLKSIQFVYREPHPPQTAIV